MSFFNSFQRNEIKVFKPCFGKISSKVSQWSRSWEFQSETGNSRNGGEALFCCTQTDLPGRNRQC